MIDPQQQQPRKDPPWWASWPLLLTSGLLLLGTGIRVAQTADGLAAEESLGMGAGLLLLGMWAATEVWRFRP